MAATPPYPDRIGRYRIEGELGRGSMGRVFLAHDPNTDRDLALKVLVETSELAPQAAEEARHRFLLEGRAAGRLSHPGIVMVYDADVDGATGNPFLAMELVRGRSLAAVLRERGPLPWREAVEIGGAVAEALDHAHAHGIVHRDVKPANVLVAEDGRVKVSDFGVAKLADESHTLTGAVLGTPSYMSPEQLRGEKVDGRSDLFGLGAMLYEMLAGEAPFRGDTLATIAHKVVNVDPRPPSFVRPDLPPEVERIVLRVLEKEPSARFQSGRELAAALRAAGRAAEAATAETQAAIPVQRTAFAATVAAGSRHRPALGRRRLAPTAVALAILAAFAGSYWLGSRPGAPPGASSPAAAPSASSRSPTRPSPPAARARAAPPARAAAPAMPRSLTPRSGARQEAATLQVLFNNRLRGAQMTVLVDGQKAWARALFVDKDPLAIVAGETVRASVNVPAGSHEIEVRILQGSARIDSRGAIRAEFGPGQRRSLRVKLVPYLPQLLLEWES